MTLRSQAASGALARWGAVRRNVIKRPYFASFYICPMDSELIPGTNSMTFSVFLTRTWYKSRELTLRWQAASGALARWGAVRRNVIKRPFFATSEKLIGGNFLSQKLFTKSFCKSRSPLKSVTRENVLYRQPAGVKRPLITSSLHIICVY